MARCVHHEACPSCGSRDNLGRYSDGSAWCFGCGYYEKGTKTLAEVKREYQQITEDNDNNTILLPFNCSRNFSMEALRWLYKYGITDKEIQENGIFYDSISDSIVFDYLPAGYQCRKMQGRPKYITKGSGMQMSLLQLERRGTVPFLIFTEDVLSAIKVSRVCPAVPLFGSYMPLELLIRGLESFKSFGLWLDSDKRKECVKQCLNARGKGFVIRPLFSEVDPKELSIEDIERIINAKDYKTK